MRTKLAKTGMCVANLLVLAIAWPWSVAADGQEQTQPAQKKAEPAKKDDRGKVLAIVGADVHTITHEVITGGTVLVKDGKILKVGQDLPIPEGATVVDARGKHVTPG